MSTLLLGPMVEVGIKEAINSSFRLHAKNGTPSAIQENLTADCGQMIPPKVSLAVRFIEAVETLRKPA